MTKPHDNVIDLAKIKVECGRCNVRQLCLPFDISQNDLDILNSIISYRKPLARGEHLFRIGDAFLALYAIRTGSVKIQSYTDEGEEQITGFHLPGEIVGLDGIHSEFHSCNAVALDTTSICEIPFARLEELASRVSGLQHQLLRLMSKEILQEEEAMLTLGKKTADERLASFLLSLSRRFQERGYSAREFRLAMSRHDIATYLGLAHETISRLLGRMHEQGLITVKGRQVLIHDLHQLQKIAGLPFTGNRSIDPYLTPAS